MFSKTAKLLIREQGLDDSGKLRVLIKKNVNDICNVMRKSGGKNVEWNARQRATGISHVSRNLKLAPFLFHHRRRCTLA